TSAADDVGPGAPRPPPSEAGMRPWTPADLLLTWLCSTTTMSTFLAASILSLPPALKIWLMAGMTLTPVTGSTGAFLGGNKRRPLETSTTAPAAALLDLPLELVMAWALASALATTFTPA